jgi:hypothetical protein
MGFHPAWKYETVHELAFEAGVMKHASDCSAEMKRIRKDVISKPNKPENPGEINSWIEKCFNQKYKL